MAYSLHSPHRPTPFHSTSLLSAPLHFALHQSTSFSPLPIALLQYAPLLSTSLRSTPLHFDPLCSTSLHFTTSRPTPLDSFCSLHFDLLHSTQLHFVPLHFTPLNTTLFHFYSTLYSTSLHFASLHSTSTPTHSILLRFTLLQLTPFYFASLYSISLHFISFHSSPLRSIHSTSITVQFTSFHSTPLYSIIGTDHQKSDEGWRVGNFPLARTILLNARAGCFFFQVKPFARIFFRQRSLCFEQRNLDQSSMFLRFIDYSTLTTDQRKQAPF